MRIRYLKALSAGLTLATVGCGQAPLEQANVSENSTVISLESTSIDIRKSDADIPSALRVQSGDAAAERFALVKFPAPLDAERDRMLRQAVDKVYTYLPEYSYLVRVPAGMGLAELRQVTGAVWVGPYHPQYKMSRAMVAVSSPEVSTLTETQRIVMVHVYPDARVDDIVERMRALGVSEVAGQGQGANFSRIRLLLTDREIVQFREALAQIPEVFWLDIEGRRVLLNDTTIWVGQSGLSGGQTTPLFTKGIYGQGQVVAILDTGIDADMCYFRDTTLGLPPRNECNGGTVVDMNQRKVIAVDFLYTGECNGGIANNEWDNQDHGTHVAGTVAGDNFASPLVHNAGDGMAPGAKLVIQDGGYAVNNCADLPGIGCPVVDLNPIFQQTYDQGARIHSNSWGDQENNPIQNDYTAASQDVDEFMWNHKDFLLVFAAGNSGPGDASVSSPSTAKSVLSVGATLRGTSANSMATFSSCGPTDDGRFKPEIVVPGANIVSANSDNSLTTLNCNTRTMSGTSMATPGAAGFAALIRQYYTDGWYPSGVANAANGFTPSAALLRASIVNSGANVTNALSMPGNCQGWGRVTLDDTLYFANDARHLWVKDDGTGFAQGSTNETQMFQFTVQSNTLPFKATLAWTDYPSTPAALPHINNDIDLEVVGPGGTYLGNVFNQGQSTTGGMPDRLNTLEQVIVASPALGNYTVTVRSFNVPNGPQPWSLVVTGDFTLPGALGAACVLAADCASSFCVDGVCCNTACNAGACDACSVAAGAMQNGTCAALTGNACDDGDACTQMDTCNAGACAGGNPVVCPMPDACHTAGTCDSATGLCSNPAKPEGSACDDGNLCTMSDTCMAGVCTAGAAVKCNALDFCHSAGTCDPATGACSNPAQPDGTACDDLNRCTLKDMCTAGICSAGSPVQCVALDDCHDVGTCAPMTGDCSNPAKPDGTLCAKGQCIAGICTPPSSTSSSSSGGGMGGNGAAGGAGGNGASGGAGGNAASGGMGGNGGSAGMGEGGKSETGGAAGSGGRPPLDLNDEGGCSCSVEDAPERGFAWAALGLMAALRRRRRS